MATRKKAVKNESSLAKLDDYAGDGSQDLDSDDQAIPFLQILHYQSPQVIKQKPEYIPGAEAGMIYETVTHGLFSELEVIPVAYQKWFNVWVHRDEGGGYRGRLPWDAETAQLLMRVGDDWRTDDSYPCGAGLTLTDTRNWYTLYRDEKQWRPALIPMSSTQIRVSRQWGSMVQNTLLPSGKQAPFFSTVYRLTTVPKSNDQGDWFVFNVEKKGWITDEAPELLQQAAVFRKDVTAGNVKVADPLPAGGESVDSPPSDGDFADDGESII